MITLVKDGPVKEHGLLMGGDEILQVHMYILYRYIHLVHVRETEGGREKERGREGGGRERVRE